jgi:hypothetical protein
MRPIGTISAVLVAVLAASSAAASDAAAKKTSRAKSHASSQVTVHRVNSGPSVPSSEFVATTWTHGDGSWALPGPLYPSEFFAVVSPRSAKRVVCGPATSNSLLWG